MDSSEPLDEAVARIKDRIDDSADQLKHGLEGTIVQIEKVIESADQLVGNLLERVNTTAGQTRDIFHSAERVAEHLEDPVGLVRKFPIAALTGAVVSGMVLGMLVRNEKRGFRRRAS